MDLWKPVEVEQGVRMAARVGPLGIWLRRRDDELHIAFHHSAEGEASSRAEPLAPSSETPPSGMRWARWVVGEDGRRVRLLPVMPDRPVVVRPESPVRIPSGHEALFFVSIPVWVRIVAGEGDRLVLCEEPSTILSKIWFGDLHSGELCYSVKTRARREVSASETRAYRAVCPTRLRNASPAQLEIERLCVHVEYLRTYEGQRQLWTNEVTVTVQGEEQTGQVRYAEEPPGIEGVGELLSEARTPLTRSLLKRGIGGLRLFGGS